MFSGQSILAIVPARGGSKGVPHKNIHPLAGKPLIAHTAVLIRAAGYMDRAVVSTDDEQIATVAEEWGLAAPFRRPQGLSGDRIGDAPVLEHALTTMEQLDQRQYDVVVMLQPTCPLRRVEHVTAALQELRRGAWDSVWTVSPVDLKYHPLKQLAIEPDGRLDLFDQRGTSIVARQQLGATYYRNGAAYALTRSCVLDQQTTKGARCGAVALQEPLVSIDTLDDFALVERVWASRASAGDV
ncbi:MAG: acylneuraminate cytidylyltransferase family protein [Vicinamibacterales bacterium]